MICLSHTAFLDMLERGLVSLAATFWVCLVMLYSRRGKYMDQFGRCNLGVWTHASSMGGGENILLVIIPWATRMHTKIQAFMFIYGEQGLVMKTGL